MMIVFARRQSRLMRGKREDRKYYRSVSLTNAVKPSSAFLHRGMLTELTELDVPPIELFSFLSSLEQSRGRVGEK